jgi:hypothetical protein
MDSGAMHTSQYFWDHKFQRPNGFSYPLACPSCRCVWSWKTISSRATASGSAFNLVCKTSGCRGTWEVPACPSSSVVDSPYVGTWREIRGPS